MVSDLTSYWEGAGEQREGNEWDRKKKEKESMGAKGINRCYF